jgi:membrane associated rhomboid family serine protease
VKLTLTTLLIVANIAAYVWQTTTRGGVEWWRIFSAAFLHASIAHIGLNMLALYSLGSVVEAIYGKARFTLLYLLAIVGSGLAIIYFAPYPQPTLGASGAIYGLFGALVAVGLRLGKRGRSMIMNVVPVLVLNLVFTFSIPGISWQAHIGGLITGFAVGYVLFMGARARRVAYAYAYATSPPGTAVPVATMEPAPEVETIEQPPDAGPHEEVDAPPPHVRDPRE